MFHVLEGGGWWCSESLLLLTPETQVQLRHVTDFHKSFVLFFNMLLNHNKSHGKIWLVQTT